MTTSYQKVVASEYVTGFECDLIRNVGIRECMTTMTLSSRSPADRDRW